MHVGKWLAALLAAKKLVGVAPELNLRELISHAPLPSANKGDHSGIETQRRHYRKSKTGISVVPKKDSCPPKFKNKTEKDLRHELTH